MQIRFHINDIEATAKEFLQANQAKKVFAFDAPMGAGKTTFIHALCEALGVKENISSPTFSIINAYSGANEQSIYHLDLYRLKDEEEALNAGVEDCLFSGNYCFVEWANKAAHLFPDDTVHVQIEIVNEETRNIIFKNHESI
jgi:tRNA threonylcarbamoyladenosine biosynthesis protein TsaE